MTGRGAIRDTLLYQRARIGFWVLVAATSALAAGELLARDRARIRR